MLFAGVWSIVVKFEHAFIIITENLEGACYLFQNFYKLEKENIMLIRFDKKITKNSRV